MSYEKCIIELNRKLTTNHRNKGLKKYLQNNKICEICGRKAVNVHHRIPISIGGSNEEYNLIALCENCHEKSHKYGIGKDTLQKNAIRLSKKSQYPLISYYDVLKMIEEDGFVTSAVEMFDIMEKCIIGYISEDYISKNTIYVTRKHQEEIQKEKNNKNSNINIIECEDNKQLKFDFREVKQ